MNKENRTVVDVFICVFVFCAEPAGEPRMRMKANKDEELFRRGSMKIFSTVFAYAHMNKVNAYVCVCVRVSIFQLILI